MSPTEHPISYDFAKVPLFVSMSAELTGFSVADLYGTGCAEDYFKSACDALGAVAVQLWTVAGGIFGGGYASLNAGDAVRTQILSDAKLGPPAKAIIKMWYLGRWEQLPDDWRTAHGVNSGDFSHVISSHAYTQSLVWITYGGHPFGAKPSGYASWALPIPKEGTEQ